MSSRSRSSRNRSSRNGSSPVSRSLEALLAQRCYIVADGAMGTQLFSAGLSAGEMPELWNVTHSEQVFAIHDAYARAGADVLLTNSFGGNRFRLALHGLQERVHELNRAAASNARRAADAETGRSGQTVLVAGSMGPTGELLEPLGAMSAEDCEAAFAAQARALAAGGADLLWIETMSDLSELEAAVSGARSACDLEVAATMSFDTAGHTMMGVSGAEMARRLLSLKLAAAGANCGNNIADTEAAVAAIAGASPGTPVISKPNAGVPVWHGDKLSYDGTPEVLAAHAFRARAAGVSIIGSCCGSTPQHTAKIVAVLAGHEPPPAIDLLEAPRTEPAPSPSSASSTSSTSGQRTRGRSRRRRSCRRR